MSYCPDKHTLEIFCCLFPFFISFSEVGSFEWLLKIFFKKVLCKKKKNKSFLRSNISLGLQNKNPLTSGSENWVCKGSPQGEQRRLKKFQRHKTEVPFGNHRSYKERDRKGRRSLPLRDTTPGGQSDSGPQRPQALASTVSVPGSVLGRTDLLLEKTDT